MDKNEYDYYYKQLSEQELARLPATDIEGITMRFSPKDAENVITRWRDARVKAGQVADAKELQRHADLYAQAQGLTPHANRLTSGTVRGVIQRLVPGSDWLGMVSKDGVESDTYRLYEGATMQVIERNMQAGTITEKSTMYEIVDKIKRDPTLQAMRDIFGTYGGKRVFDIKYTDLSDRGATDARAVVDRLAEHYAIEMGRSPSEVSALDKEEMTKRLLISPERIPAKYLDSVILGQNMLTKVEEGIRTEAARNGWKPHEVEQAIAKWRELPRWAKVRRYVLATINVKTNDPYSAYAQQDTEGLGD